MSGHRAIARSGFTLVEMMIALVVLSAVMGATLSVLRNQTSSFRTAGDRLELFQNMRYATTTIDRLLRTTGAGVASQQPMFVYGGNDVVAFNTDHTSVLQTGCSVNVNPDAPAGSHEIMTMAQAYVLPNTAFTYPAANYPTATGTSCDAETIVLYFRPDSTTPDDVTDFMLLQRVNARPPEMVARNLFPYPGRPFFEYFVHPRTLPVPPATRDSLVQANLAGSGVPLPIRHLAAIHGSATDSVGDPSNSYLADSVKAVRINIRVSNGLLGPNRRVRDFSTITSLPNNGLVQVKTCGTSPLLAGALNVTQPAGPGTPMLLAWAASIDEAAGEGDVTQYNIYRRQLPSLTLELLTTIPAGQPNYVYPDNGVTPGLQYVWAVAAQDCTPAESPMLQTLPTTVP
jgi:prepilin-type N-terminal cleavage/methylation domain-containing protein